MPPDSLPLDLDSLRRELGILRDEQEKAMALGVYIAMSDKQTEEFDSRRTRINELVLILAAI